MGGEAFDKRRPWTQWSQEEHDKLMRLVQEQQSQGRSDICWTDVAKHLPNRSGKQCSRKYDGKCDVCVFVPRSGRLCNSSPGMKSGAWTLEEDYKLAELHSQHGSSWSVIAARIGNRGENGVKNHWNAMLRSKYLHTKRDSVLANYVTLIREGEAWGAPTFEKACRITSDFTGKPSNCFDQDSAGMLHSPPHRLPGNLRPSSAAGEYSRSSGGGAGNAADPYDMRYHYDPNSPPAQYLDVGPPTAQPYVEYQQQEQQQQQGSCPPEPVPGQQYVVSYTQTGQRKHHVSEGGMQVDEQQDYRSGLASVPRNRSMAGNADEEMTGSEDAPGTGRTTPLGLVTPMSRGFEREGSSDSATGTHPGDEGTPNSVLKKRRAQDIANLHGPNGGDADMFRLPAKRSTAGAAPPRNMAVADTGDANGSTTHGWGSLVARNAPPFSDGLQPSSVQRVSEGCRSVETDQSMLDAAHALLMAARITSEPGAISGGGSDDRAHVKHPSRLMRTATRSGGGAAVTGTQQIAGMPPSPRGQPFPGGQGMHHSQLAAGRAVNNGHQSPFYKPSNGLPRSAGSSQGGMHIDSRMMTDNRDSHGGNMYMLPADTRAVRMSGMEGRAAHQMQIMVPPAEYVDVPPPSGMSENHSHGGAAMHARAYEGVQTVVQHTAGPTYSTAAPSPPPNAPQYVLIQDGDRQVLVPADSNVQAFTTAPAPMDMNTSAPHMYLSQYPDRPAVHYHAQITGPVQVGYSEYGQVVYSGASLDPPHPQYVQQRGAYPSHINNVKFEEPRESQQVVYRGQHLHGDVLQQEPHSYMPQQPARAEIMHAQRALRPEDLSDYIVKETGPNGERVLIPRKVLADEQHAPQHGVAVPGPISCHEPAPAGSEYQRNRSYLELQSAQHTQHHDHVKERALEAAARTSSGYDAMNNPPPEPRVVTTEVRSQGHRTSTADQSSLPHVAGEHTVLKSDAARHSTASQVAQQQVAASPDVDGSNHHATEGVQSMDCMQETAKKEGTATSVQGTAYVLPGAKPATSNAQPPDVNLEHADVGAGHAAAEHSYDEPDMQKQKQQQQQGIAAADQATDMDVVSPVAEPLPAGPAGTSHTMQSDKKITEAVNAYHGDGVDRSASGEASSSVEEREQQEPIATGSNLSTQPGSVGHVNVSPDQPVHSEAEGHGNAAGAQTSGPSNTVTAVGSGLDARPSVCQPAVEQAPSADALGRVDADGQHDTNDAVQDDHSTDKGYCDGAVKLEHPPPTEPHSGLAASSPSAQPLYSVAGQQRAVCAVAPEKASDNDDLARLVAQCLSSGSGATFHRTASGKIVIIPTSLPVEQPGMAAQVPTASGGGARMAPPDFEIHHNMQGATSAPTTRQHSAVPQHAQQHAAVSHLSVPCATASIHVPHDNPQAAAAAQSDPDQRTVVLADGVYVKVSDASAVTQHAQQGARGSGSTLKMVDHHDYQQGPRMRSVTVGGDGYMPDQRYISVHAHGQGPSTTGAATAAHNGDVCPSQYGGRPVAMHRLAYSAGGSTQHMSLTAGSQGHMSSGVYQNGAPYARHVHSVSVGGAAPHMPLQYGGHVSPPGTQTIMLSDGRYATVMQPLDVPAASSQAMQQGITVSHRADGSSMGGQGYVVVPASHQVSHVQHAQHQPQYTIGPPQQHSGWIYVQQPM